MNLEEAFIKEFKANLRYGSDIRNIYNVPLPEDVKDWEVTEHKEVGISGIEDRYYSKLNKTVAKIVPRGSIILKREIDLITRDFKLSDEGVIIKTEVKTPENSLVVISKVNLGLPYGYKSDDSRLSYVDFIGSTTREFMYIIPKNYLYNLNTTALALSVKSMKVFAGMGYHTWDYGMLFLNVIPFSQNRQYVGTKILKTKVGTNYYSEIKKIVDFWVENKIIADPKMCYYDDGNSNLVLKDTDVAYESYEPIESFSLSEKEIYGGEEVEKGLV